MGSQQALNLADTYKCVDALLSVITDLIRADQSYVLSSDADVTNLVRLATTYLEHNNYPTNIVYSVIASTLFILESIARTKQEEDVLMKEIIPIDALVKPLFNYGSNVKIASEVISSFNTIYTLSHERTQARMRTIYVEKKIHKTIYDSLLRGGQKVSSEVSHQLYLMQVKY